MAEGEAKNSGQKKTLTVKEVKIAPPQRKQNLFISSVKWGVLFFVLFLALAYGLNYYLNSGRDILTSFQNKQPVSAIDQNESELVVSRRAAQILATETMPPDPNKPAGGENFVEQSGRQFSDIRTEINAIKQKITSIEEGNRNLIIYFSARDLKESIDNPDQFRNELGFLRQVIGDNPDVNGNMDILEQATANDMITRVKLLEELKLLGRKIETEHNKGFQANIENAIGNLVKISKIEGEVAAGDYESTLKRATLRLASDKLTIAVLQQTINEVAKLGPAADDFIRHANNLKRIMEVTDHLVYYAKARVVK